MIDLDGAQPCSSTSIRAGRPRGHKETKADMKCYSLTLHYVGTLKDLYVENDVSNEKMDARKRWARKKP
jgi:hypothetical protein